MEGSKVKERKNLFDKIQRATVLRVLIIYLSIYLFILVKRLALCFASVSVMIEEVDWVTLVHV